MLKKIAHNSTVPALAIGNRDLRQLQDLITTEKGVLQSLQKLSADVNKAGDSLRAWGQGEGEDLADVLTASSALLSHFAAALTGYAIHEASVREELKSIRSREESLDELRARRKAQMTKADAADRKLSKMKPDNKNLQEQSDLVHRLREDIRIMDTDIMAEEASLGDYKRVTAKAFLNLKFAGLIECCRKGAIAGEYGMMVIEEISIEQSQPGLPRPFYMGKSRTLSLMAEAQGAITNIQFPVQPFLSQQPTGQPPLDSRHASFYGSQAPVPGYTPSASSGSPPTSPQPAYASSGRPPSIVSTAPLSPHSTGYTPYGQPQPLGAIQQQPSYEEAVSEFGYAPSARPSSMRTSDVGGPRAPSARYSTVPSRLGGPRPQSGFSAPQMDDRAPSLDITPGDESFSSSIASALEGSSQPTRRISMHKPPLNGPQSNQAEPWQVPPPMYSPAPHPLPPGAAPPHAYGGQWSQQENDAGPSASHEATPMQHQEQAAEEGLAYMNEGEEFSEGSHAGDDSDRRVTFDERVDPEEQSQSELPAIPSIDTTVATPRPDQTSFHRRGDTEETEVGVTSPDRETHQYQQLAGQEEPPTPSSHKTEESLNAIAAREVSRELDALMAGTYVAANRTPSPLLPPQAPFARRSVSPRTDIDATPSPASTPRVEYTRERHRSPSNAQSTMLDNDSSTTLAFPSPALSTATTNPYRTPLETPAPAAASSFYNLSSMSGSNQSVGTGVRTISAAAFRRQRQPTSPPIESSNGRTSPEANTNPLSINKRPLPQSPLSGPTASPISPVRRPSVPAGGPRDLDSGGGDVSRSEGHEHDEYDYISAYTQPREDDEHDGLR